MSGSGLEQCQTPAHVANRVKADTGGCVAVCSHVVCAQLGDLQSSFVISSHVPYIHTPKLHWSPYQASLPLVTFVMSMCQSRSPVLAS